MSPDLLYPLNCPTNTFRETLYLCMAMDCMVLRGICPEELTVSKTSKHYASPSTEKCVASRFSGKFFCQIKPIPSARSSSIDLEPSKQRS